MYHQKANEMKTKYSEYDYEAVYEQSIDDMDEWFAKRALERAIGVYATKEIVFGDHMDIDIYPEFAKRKVKEFPKVDKAKERERMKALNGRKARKYFRRLCECNFTDGDLWITLTYTNEPESIEAATKCMHSFIRRVNRKRERLDLPKARYIYITECVSENGETVRVHHHLLMDSLLDMDTVLSLWRYGGRNEARYLKTDENGIAGAAEYMSKPAADTKRKKHEKRWTASRNLLKPQEHKHHQTRTSEVTKMVRNRDHIKEYVENAKYRSGELRYKGYICESNHVYFNEVNGGYYISIHLRRKEKTSGKGSVAGRMARIERGRSQRNLGKL